MSELKNTFGRACGPATAALVCIGGPPGAGKTTVGHIVQKHLPGSVLVDPDVIRLEILGRPPGSAVTEADLAPAVTQHVIARMKAQTEAALHAGNTVIVPSAFILQAMRDDFEAIASRLPCPLHAFWLQAADATLAQRQQQRAKTTSETFNNASKVVSNDPALTRLQGTLSPRWQTLPAEETPEKIAQKILDKIKGRSGPVLTLTPD